MKAFSRFLILALWLLSFPVEAGACFNSTVCGTGTSDLYTTAAFAPGSSYSISYWSWNNQTAGSPVTMSTSGNNTNFLIYQNSSATTTTIQQVFSGARGSWHITTQPNGSWAHNCITYNGTSTANNPIWYVNGTSQSITVEQAPTGTISESSQVLAAGGWSGSTSQEYSGKLSEVAFWNNTILTASECNALSGGATPLKVRGAALTVYLPLYDIGGKVLATDWSPNHYTITTGGTPLAVVDGVPQKCYPEQGCQP